MKIVVDLQAAQSGSRHGGIGRYSIDLFKSMVRHHPQHQFIGLLNGLFPQGENEVRSSLRNILPPSDIITFPAPSGCSPSRQKPQLMRAAEIIRECFISNLSPDLVHISSVVEGLYEDVVSSIGRIEGRSATTATFYDLIPMVEQGAYLKDPMARSHYFERVRMLERADALLAISKFVADEGARLLSNFRGTIVNINGGIDSKFTKLVLNEKITSIRRKFKLNKKFILYTASFDQRKNQKGLIRAFSKIRTSVRKDYQLAFAGGSSPEVYSRLMQSAGDIGLSENDVLFLGRVTDEELVTLYNCCDLFAFPSRLEGLGMPVLEAMACGAPVIGSNTSSIKEVVGFERALFDPDDVDEIASKLELALLDQDFRSELVEHGKRHIENYTWRKSAAIAVSAFESLVGEGRPSAAPAQVVTSLKSGAYCEDLVDQDLDQVAKASLATTFFQSKPWLGNQYRIGWVTSWGARCGIASYSKELIQHLSQMPVILASYKNHENLNDEPNAAIRCWADGKEDYLIELFSAVQSNNLQAIHIQFNYGFYDFEALRVFIEKCACSGISVFITLHSTFDQSDIPHYRLEYLKSALSLCRALFVHSIHDVTRLSSLGLAEKTKLIPVGVRAFERHANRPTKAQYVISTYGFALPGKGLMEAVLATAILRQSGFDVKLKMVNANYGDAHNISNNYIADIKEAIIENDLEDRVELITDFLSDEESFSLVSDSDIVLFPYTKTGESGSAAIRLGLASGRIVATTPLPIFDDVGDCVYQMSGTSPRMIAESLTRLINHIQNGDALVEDIRRSAERLLSSTDHKQVARLIDSEIRRLTFFDSFVERFRLSKASTLLKGGRFIEAGIIGNTSGVLCYGPYETLLPGLCRVTIFGEMESDLVATAVFGSRSETFTRCPLQPSDNGILADFMVNISSISAGVEIVISTERDGRLLITDYVVAMKAV